MHRTRIKICSICSPADADLAVNAGADAIGLILHPASKRCVDLALARDIVARVPAFVTPVGVFVDATLDALTHAARGLHLPCVQLSGHESPDYALNVARLGIRFTKALKVDESLPGALEVWRKALPDLAPHFGAILLETPGGAPGGSGIANDWPAIRHFIDSGLFAALPPLLAAGGLTPATVHDVVRLIRPYAVDVSSGVEAELRRKSPEKITQFIAEVRRADALAP